MSEFRRRLMMVGGGSSPYDEYGYIKEGKIFHLDGINKGGTANAWTDIVGGIVFTPRGSVTENTNNFYFPGTTANGFESTGALSPNIDTTVEVCYIPENAAHTLFIYKKDKSTPVFHKNNNNITFLQNRYTYTYAMTVSNPYTISLNPTEGLVNGNTISPNTGTDYWTNESDVFYIGSRRATGINPFKGTLYSIRIYSRNLTAAEMLHNQGIDNERFNLGLTL